MISYNVTVKIDHSAHEDWYSWMTEHHIPDVMATGLFLEYRMSRMLGLEDDDGYTYSIQYYLENMDFLQRYQNEFAEKLQAEHSERYANKFVAFRTLMVVVDRSKPTV
jgi:hypothetical protein